MASSYRIVLTDDERAQLRSQVGAGVVTLVLVTEPRRGWRQVRGSAQRTRLDFAPCLKDLVDVHSPDAERIVLVLDQLNTHSPASLSAAFPPTEAKRLADRLEIHHTPTHGSWLNMAELELSALARQGLRQRLGNRAAMAHAVAAWTTRRNARTQRIAWRFTTADARINRPAALPGI